MGLFCDCDENKRKMNRLNSEIEELDEKLDQLLQQFNEFKLNILNLKKVNSEELSKFEHRIEQKINDHIIQFAINYKAEAERMKNK